MIVAVGTDLVEIERIRRAHARHGQRLIERVLGPDERQRLPTGDPAAWLAKRFATKEAVAKALGTGFRDGLRLVDIQTLHDDQGRPDVRLEGRAAESLARLGGRSVWLSVTDERAYALAFVVISA